MKSIPWKRMLPHAIVVVVCIALTLLFFYPLLEGKVIRQADVMNFKGMSKEIVDFRDQYDKEPLWTNSMFSGMPAYQISVFYPANLIKPITNFFGWFAPHPSTIIMLSLIGFYLLLQTMGAGLWISVFGAIAFSFSSYLIILIEAGHNPKGYAIAYMAPVVAGIFMTYRGRLWTGSALTALALSLELSVNHIQITYYLAILCLFLVLGEYLRHLGNKEMMSFFKKSAFLLVAVVLSVGPNITNLLITQEYGKYSTRGKSDLTDDAENKTTGLDRDYATQWSYGVSETLTLMIPNFKGGQSQAIGNNKTALANVDNTYAEYISQLDQYWGDQPFTSGPVYLGAIICFLFVLGMFIIKDPIKWYLFAAAVLMTSLSWGKNFPDLTDFFMDHVPGYNKFRAVSMTLVVVQFCLPLIAALAIRDIVADPGIIRKKKNFFFASVGLTGGLCLLMYLSPDSFQEFFKDGEYNQLQGQLSKAGFSESQAADFLGNVQLARIAIFKEDAGRSFFLILIAAALLFVYVRKPFNSTLLIGALCLLTLGDLWTINKRYLNKENFVSKSLMETPYLPSAADEMIFKDADPYYRVLNTAVNTFNDASTSYFHHSIGGYHGAKLKRYQELIEKQIRNNNMAVLNMLNTKYFIVRGPEGQDPVAQLNVGALGNAWFVRHLKKVANADAEMKAITRFNPRDTAIYDQRFSSVVKVQDYNPAPGDYIKLTSYRADLLSYEYEASSELAAVFSDIYYDRGWNAYIDGKPVQHFRVNYVLRSLVVEKGKHKLEFKFEPQTYYNGEKIALAGSILLLAFIGTGFFIGMRSKSAEWMVPKKS